MRRKTKNVSKEYFYQSTLISKLLVACIFILLPSLGLFGQTITINGTVSSINGPLPNVTVVVQGSNLGTQTSKDGHYSIKASPSGILIFTAIGFKTQMVNIDNRNTIDIKLELESKSMGEVVVVGYGTAQKATVTGAISSIGGQELKSSPTINFTNSLAGKLPGLIATVRSGEPGNDDAVLRIRGANTLGDNSPLIVIDGIANRSMQRLDPSDIENVTILKDASAAIYGAEAANGVILITTKRGKPGKPQITLNLNHGIVKPTVLPKMSDAATYAQMVNEMSIYSGGAIVYKDDEIQKYRDGSDPFRFPNTNWVKTVFKPLSQQDYGNVSLSGGSEGMRYFVSMGANYQDGIYRNSATNYSQYDFRSNLDAKITKDIKLSLDIAGRQENRNYPTIDQQTIFSFAVTRSLPNVVAFYGPGLPGSNFEAGNNPAVIATNQTGYDHNKRYFFMSNIRLDVNVPWIRGLSLTGNASLDKNFVNDKTWRTPWTLYTWDGSTMDPNGKPSVTGVKSGYADPNLTQSMDDGHATTLNFLLNYNTTISDKHNLKLLLGTEKNVTNIMNFSAYRRYFISTQIDQLFAGGDLDKNNNGSADQSARLNYFGRLNYDYLSKYMVEFLFRYDGSYIFPKDKRFGFFPGVSIGWQLGRENFWKNSLSFINQFKLRASWGQTGNDRISEYQYLSSMGFGNPLVLNGDVQNKTINELRIANPNVTWEVANQSDIGIDGEMFDSKVKFSFDYFYNLRSNILTFRNASVPGSTGLTLPMENIGKVVNKGFEFMISYANNNNENFRYEISINGGFAKNRIKFWDEPPGAPIYQRSTGHPMNSNLYYQAIGIYRDQAEIDSTPHWIGAIPGDVQFKDINGDGKIDGNDMVRDNRSDIPTFTGGFGASLGYKNFYATIFFQGATGAYRYKDATHSGAIGNFYLDDAEGRWTQSNPDASKPRTWNGSGAYWTQQPNTHWLQNNNYLRLKNVEVGYNFPKTLLNRMGISSATIYFSGLNMLTFDHLSDFDPETIIDNAYPPNKVYNLGLTLTF